MNKGLYSSDKDDWETPKELFNALEKEFKFRLDPCCSINNCKCPTGYTKEADGLTQDWTPFETIFMNPPYGRVIGGWMKKAHETAQAGSTVVCLVPARTDTAWFQDYCLDPKYEIRFIKGRLKFSNSKNSAPFPSAIVIMKTIIPKELKV